VHLGCGTVRYVDLVVSIEVVVAVVSLYSFVKQRLKCNTGKVKRVQACIDARGHHFQHLL
jgi:hypothetical protein